MTTTRLSDDVLADAEIVGAHAEPTEYQTDSEVVVAKVVTRTSKGVKHK